MISIRRNTFETNSSSTHSLAIPKNAVNKTTIVLQEDDFGWEFDEGDPASYIYTWLCEYGSKQDSDRFFDILKRNNIEYIIRKNRKDYYGIDHGDRLENFVQMLLSDEDKLIRFLCGGKVYTGNDNCSSDEYPDFFVWIKEFEDYDMRLKKWVKKKNPNYQTWTEDYEWFEKGN